MVPRMGFSNANDYFVSACSLSRLDSLPLSICITNLIHYTSSRQSWIKPYRSVCTRVYILSHVQSSVVVLNFYVPESKSEVRASQKFVYLTYWHFIHFAHSEFQMQHSAHSEFKGSFASATPVAVFNSSLLLMPLLNNTLIFSLLMAKPTLRASDSSTLSTSLRDAIDLCKIEAYHLQTTSVIHIALLPSWQVWFVVINTDTNRVEDSTTEA